MKAVCINCATVHEVAEYGQHICPKCGQIFFCRAPQAEISNPNITVNKRSPKTQPAPAVSLKKNPLRFMLHVTGGVILAVSLIVLIFCVILGDIRIAYATLCGGLFFGLFSFSLAKIIYLLEIIAQK